MQKQSSGVLFKTDKIAGAPEMKVHLKNAVDRLYKSCSVLQTLTEAVANSMDAKATEIKINVSGDIFKKGKKSSSISYIKNLCIQVDDNGVGFNKQSRERFATLFLTANEQHKGMGRLSYLKNFKNIHIESWSEREHSDFDFSTAFSDDAFSIGPNNTQKTGTILTLSDPVRAAFSSYEFSNETIKANLIKSFLYFLYDSKVNKHFPTIEIVFNLRDDGNSFSTSKTRIDPDDIFDLEKTSINVGTDIIDCYYQFIAKNINFNEHFIATSVDNRTLFLEDCKNASYNGKIIIFLVKLSKTTTDNCRTGADISPDFKKALIASIKAKIFRLAKEQIKDFKTESNKRYNSLLEKLPFLSYYMDPEMIGMYSNEEITRQAWNKQREYLLEFFNTPIDEEHFDKTFKAASCILGEYIIYRDKIINLLQNYDYTNNEGKIHDLICRRKQIDHHGVDYFEKNNLWLIDDKFMSYSYLYSDQELNKFVKEISGLSNDPNLKDGAGRPDLAIAFSSDPQSSEQVDVVIVEFKKHNVGLNEVVNLLSELIRRAAVLNRECHNKLGRAWYFGISDFNKEARDYLSTEFSHKFSKGECFYMQKPLHIRYDDNDDEAKTVPADIYMLSYDSVIKDAKARNQTFKDILIREFKQHIEN